MLIQPSFIFAAAVVAFIIAYLARPRRFYLVRHGETVMNAQKIKQGAEGELSEIGRAQAEHVGKYLAQFRVSRILASTYPRAQETATIINTYLKVPILSSALLVERRNPSEAIGKHRDDPEVQRIVDQIDLAYHDDDFRFSDEENFADLKKRARRCLRLLSLQGSRETCVVTHHVFLKALIAYLLYRKRLHAKDFAKLSFFNVSDNAGIAIIEYHPWRMFNQTRGWEVVSYNEQAA